MKPSLRIGLALMILGSGISQPIVRPSATGSAALSGDEILARIELETKRRHAMLNEYSGAREYTLQNTRFGKQAAVAGRMTHKPVEPEQFTVSARSGSPKLNGIIDQVIASETGASVPPENQRHQISAANYRVRLLGTETAVGRECYVLALTPKVKSRYLVDGKAWVDTGSYAIVRIEGQFAASISMLVGAPHITEEFTEVQGYWLPAHVRSVTSSFLLGPTELEIRFSDYQLEPPATLGKLGDRVRR